MSRSSLTAPASPKENLGRPAARLLLRLIEPRSIGGRFDAFALRQRPCGIDRLCALEHHRSKSHLALKTARMREFSSL
jgi:hypothetical protein